jgi:glycine betaine/proline transport system substrate-binding protein
MAQISRQDDAIVLAYSAESAATSRHVEVCDVLLEAVDRGGAVDGLLFLERRREGSRDMKTLLALTCLSLGLMAISGPATAAECGDVTIANMNWQSAEVLANVDKIILTSGYGCNVELVIGDTVPTLTSMVEKGQPDIAPEGWVDLLPDVVNRGVKEGKLVAAAQALSDGAVQGWWIPKYVADAHPEIKTIGDVFKHPELFPAPEDASKGAVFNGPQGWGGTVVTAQLFKAYGGDKANFTLVDTGTAAGLDGSVAKAYERKESWVGYYWAPTSLLGKYEMVKLAYDVPADPAEWKRCNTVADCADPKPNAWPADHVETLVTKGFADRAGPAMDYLKARAWSNATVNKLLAWMTDNQAKGEDGAKYFLKNNQDIWTKWVPADVAAKVLATL